jgi:hypothetical protein
MRRAISLFVFALAVSLTASACSDLAGPASDDCGGVVVGSQTRCTEPPK